jgi:hypothetical protein
VAAPVRMIRLRNGSLTTIGLGHKWTLEQLLVLGRCEVCGNRQKAHRLMGVEEHVICKGCLDEMYQGNGAPTLSISEVADNPYAPPRETRYRYD